MLIHIKSLEKDDYCIKFNFNDYISPFDNSEDNFDYQNSDSFIINKDDVFLIEIEYIKNTTYMDLYNKLKNYNSLENENKDINIVFRIKLCLKNDIKKEFYICVIFNEDKDDNIKELKNKIFKQKEISLDLDFIKEEIDNDKIKLNNLIKKHSKNYINEYLKEINLID